MHLILFDGECAFCNLAVRHIIAIDKKKKFLFAPLKSKTAKAILKERYDSILRANTMVLIENQEVWIRAKAILRVYWIVGRSWRAVGIFSFLPGFLGDIFYRIFALNRYRFKIKAPVTLESGRLLD